MELVVVSGRVFESSDEWGDDFDSAEVEFEDFVDEVPVVDVNVDVLLEAGEQESVSQPPLLAPSVGESVNLVEPVVGNGNGWGSGFDNAVVEETVEPAVETVGERLVSPGGPLVGQAESTPMVSVAKAGSVGLENARVKRKLPVVSPPTPVKESGGENAKQGKTVDQGEANPVGQPLVQKKKVDKSVGNKHGGRFGEHRGRKRPPVDESLLEDSGFEGVDGFPLKASKPADSAPLVAGNTFSAEEVFKGAGRRKGGRPKGKSKGFRVSERDVRIISFLGRYKYATIAQLARKFETSEQAMYLRLPRLAKEGLVTSEWGYQGRAKLWFPTRTGLHGLAGMDLPITSAKKVAWGHLRHTLALTDLATSFELQDEVVVSEREIRSAATRRHRVGGRRSHVDEPYGLAAPSPRVLDAVRVVLEAEGITPEAAWTNELTTGEVMRNSYTVPMPGSKPVPRGAGKGAELGRIPDMAVLRGRFPDGRSGSIAVELELQGKPQWDYVKLVRAYCDYEGYAMVHWYAGSPRVLRRIDRAIKEVPGGARKNVVEMFTPYDTSALPLASVRQ